MNKLDENLKLIYPSLFPIKIFIENNEMVVEHIHFVVSAYMDLTEQTIQKSSSSNNKYLCLNVNLMAESEIHIQNFCNDVKKHKSVKMII